MHEPNDADEIEPDAPIDAGQTDVYDVPAMFERRLRILQEELPSINLNKTVAAAEQDDSMTANEAEVVEAPEVVAPPVADAETLESSSATSRFRALPRPPKLMHVPPANIEVEPELEPELEPLFEPDPGPEASSETQRMRAIQVGLPRPPNRG